MTTRVVAVDHWDLRRYDTLDFPAFRADGAALLALAPVTGAALWADLFALVDLARPRLREVDEVDPAYRVNHTVLTTLAQAPELDRLRALSVGDAFYAGSACITLRPALEIAFDRAQVTQRMRDALAYGLGGLAGLDDVEVEQDPGLAAAEAELEALESREAGRRALLLRSSLAKAVAEAEAEDARSRMWTAGMDMTRMSAERRLALARRMKNPAFEGMVDLFGAMERLQALVARDVIPGIPSVPGQVEYGRDLTRVLPSALVRMGDPDLGDLFLADYAEGRLPQRAMTGTTEVGRGGIIGCFDTSISMARTMRPKGTRDMRSKAMGLLLLNQAREQGRPFHAIVFSDRYERGHPLDGQPQLTEYDFTGDYTAEQVLDFAEEFHGGRTSFTLPLDCAVAILEDEFAATGHTRSDVVIVSDGEAPVTTDWIARYLERMHRVGGRTWGLLLAGAHTEPLTTICEGRVATFDEITTPGADLRAVMSGLAA